MADIDIYPVGLHHDLKQWANNPDRAAARRRLARDLKRPLAHLRAREWRPLKSYLNGYLAEPREFPSGLTRCGSGWTRGRALRDLNRRVTAAADREFLDQVGIR